MAFDAGDVLECRSSIRELSRADAWCPAKDQGCTATVTYSRLKEHWDLCEHNTRHCACGSSVQAAVLAQHQRDECTHREVVCPQGCGRRFQHLASAEHQAVCPRQPVCCVVPGCGAKMVRADVDGHMAAMTVHHINALSLLCNQQQAQLQTQQDQLRAQQRDLKAQQEKLKAQERTAETQQEELQSLQRQVANLPLCVALKAVSEGKDSEEKMIAVVQHYGGAGVTVFGPRCVRLQKHVSDALVTEIARHCPQLQHLDLTLCSDITDTSLTEVARHCPQLQHLDLTRCSQITDASMTEVARHCPQLQYLDLCSCDITDTSMTEVARHCPQLQHLYLDRCYITDTFLAEVAHHCPQLHHLGLFGCNITDTSLKEVARHCPTLKVYT